MLQIKQHSTSTCLINRFKHKAKTMHGIIFVLFNKFIRVNYDFKKLHQIKNEAGMHNKMHEISKAHPDSEIFSLVSAASKSLNVEADQLLESFGKFIAPELIKTYGSYLDSEWACLDLLEHVEKTMHRIVRSNTPDADPPKLDIKRIGTNQVSIDYTSNRKIISLGIGIIYAIAEHYNEEVKIENTAIPNGTNLIITTV